MTDSARKAQELARQHGIDLSKLPKIADMSAESITANVHAINSNCPDERLKFIMKSLTTHLHDFVRETSITNDEWMVAIKFLTEAGKRSTEIIHDLSILSYCFGVLPLIDSIHDIKPPEATTASALGPAFLENAHEVANGDSIASEGNGEYLYVEGRILDTKGNPIPNAVINTWETDGDGLYDIQHPGPLEPNYRGRLLSREDGTYAFRAIVPVPYPVTFDGPAGDLLVKLGRHFVRPAHLHFRIDAPGYNTLVTALFWKGDPYLSSDPVFGVRNSLIIETETVSDPAKTKARGFAKETSHQYLKRDFVLATPEECRLAKEAKAKGIAAEAQN